VRGPAKGASARDGVSGSAARLPCAGVRRAWGRCGAALQPAPDRAHQPAAHRVRSGAEIAYARLFDRRFDLEGVAGKLRLGTRTLQRRLARDGQGYRTILQHVRDLHARDLLAGTDLPMTEIAWSLGYDDPAHFSRAFRRTADMAPTRFRQIARARG
jgi:AraC-like DNA-binding protein